MNNFRDLRKKWSAQPEEKIIKEMQDIIESVTIDTEALLDALEGLKDGNIGPDEGDYMILFYGFWMNAAPEEFVKSLQEAARARHPLALKFENLLYDAAVKLKITKETTI